MKCLFIHQNFPAQFGPIATYLASDSKNEVVAIGSSTARSVANIAVHRYQIVTPDIRSVHPFARRFDIECRRAEQIVYIGTDIRASGFDPDLVVVHCGWGESLPIRSLFPSARIATYCEFFYNVIGRDVGFDTEWDDLTLDAAVSLRARNAATLLALTETDVAWSPTEWQRSTFPALARPFIDVCHEGVDLAVVRPNPSASITLPNQETLRAGDEVVTFVARNLEPLRGFHIFMRALPNVLRNRPNARVLVIGGDGLSYGASPPSGRSWRDIFFEEVHEHIDSSRVHFLGQVAYNDFLAILQISAVHIYLTYPFVLSWSMLEAMAAGCVVIGSATGPVEEVIDGRNGLLVDFFDIQGLAQLICRVLADPQGFVSMRQRARETVSSRFARMDCLSIASKMLSAGLA